MTSGGGSTRADAAVVNRMRFESMVNVVVQNSRRKGKANRAVYRKDIERV